MEGLLGAFGVDWKLLLVQVVNFGILIVALWYFLYKPVLQVLTKRQALIQQGVEDARSATEKLEHADDEAKERIRTADGEAAALVQSAREAGAKERARLVHEAELRAEAIEKDAAARAEESKAKALRESEKEIARLAILAAGKALEKKS